MFKELRVKTLPFVMYIMLCPCFRLREHLPHALQSVKPTGGGHSENVRLDFTPTAFQAPKPWGFILHRISMIADSIVLTT
jgi:hypothetical protein